MPPTSLTCISAARSSFALSLLFRLRLHLCLTTLLSCQGALSYAAKICTKKYGAKFCAKICAKNYAAKICAIKNAAN